MLGGGRGTEALLPPLAPRRRRGANHDRGVPADDQRLLRGACDQGREPYPRLQGVLEACL